MTFSGNRSILYTYAADGTRLRAVHSRKVGNTWLKDSTDYCGSLILQNGAPGMYQFTGGYISFSNSALSGCHYYIQDYLGNNRMVVNKTGAVEQTTHYYPYGGVIGGIDHNPGFQKYKYGGKELDRSYGLDWYDVQARQYDPVVPSWHTIDPLAEKYYWISPYAYCAGNPVNAVDPDGRSTWVVNKGNGLYQIVGGDLADNDLSIYVGYFEGSNFHRFSQLGITTTLTSFYNSDNNGGEWETNSYIDVNDRSGSDFLLRIIGNNPPMFDDYMMNARNNHSYDFKATNGTEVQITGIDHYRGMPIGKMLDGRMIFSSARDIGNMTAGYVAAVNGMDWNASRMVFDTYQLLTNSTLEGPSTRNAEYLGWLIGHATTNRFQNVCNFVRSVNSLFVSLWKSMK